MEPGRQWQRSYSAVPVSPADNDTTELFHCPGQPGRQWRGNNTNISHFRLGQRIAFMYSYVVRTHLRDCFVCVVQLIVLLCDAVHLTRFRRRRVRMHSRSRSTESKTDGTVAASGSETDDANNVCIIIAFTANLKYATLGLCLANLSS